jgi:hypothetical protein
MNNLLPDLFGKSVLAAKYPYSWLQKQPIRIPRNIRATAAAYELKRG